MAVSPEHSPLIHSEASVTVGVAWPPVPGASAGPHLNKLCEDMHDGWATSCLLMPAVLTACAGALAESAAPLLVQHAPWVREAEPECLESSVASGTESTRLLSAGCPPLTKVCHPGGFFSAWRALVLHRALPFMPRLQVPPAPDRVVVVSSS